MLSVLDETILIMIHNIHFHDKLRNKIHKMSLNICFLELSEEFPKDFKTSLNQSRSKSHRCSSH